MIRPGQTDDKTASLITIPSFLMVFSRGLVLRHSMPMVRSGVKSLKALNREGHKR